MKSNPSLRLSIALVLALPFALLHASTGSLLPEGSLEITNPAGTGPQGWGGARNVVWIEEEGNHFFRITADPGKQVGLYEKARVSSEIKALELSFRARVTGLERGEQNWFDARVIINFKDADGNRLPPPKLPYFSRDTEGWVSINHRILVPENAATIELMPTLFKARSGEFDIDDIILKPIDPALFH